MIKFNLEKDGSLKIEDYSCDLSVETIRIEKQDVEKLRQLLSDGFSPSIFKFTKEIVDYNKKQSTGS